MTHQRKIQHLYLRAGFGLSPEEWLEKKDIPLQEAVNQLFEKAKFVPRIESEEAAADLSMQAIRNLSREEKAKLRKQERKKVALQNANWLERMANPNESPLLEKMSLFWHGHFACTSKGSRLALAQLNSLRRHALGNFRELALAIAKDASMIRFLNNQQNRKRQPNENFARELMELFTIGRGNYSEKDVKEAARAFTGWSSNFRGEFVFRSFQHDYGNKTFLGKSGDFNGEDIIDLLLEKKETARFVTRKIYRYFVNEKIDEDRVVELADLFYNSNYDIGKLMRAIFESDWFYEDENVGSKIKSPVEFLAGIERNLKVQFEREESIVLIQKALGQLLFNPPNVAGWPGGKSWIDNSTLMLRLNLVNHLFQIAEFDFRVKPEFEAKEPNQGRKKLNASLDFQELIATFSNENEEDVFEELTSFFIQAPVQLDKQLFDEFTRQDTKENYIKTLTMRLMSLPEYQLC